MSYSYRAGCKIAPALVAVSALLSGGIAFGTVQSNVPHNTTSSSQVVDEWGFSLLTSSTLEADLTAPEGEHLHEQSEFTVKNVGKISAQYAFYIEPVTFAMDGAVWDESSAVVSMHSSSGASHEWAGSVREFLTTAFVTDEVIEAGDTATVTVSITPSSGADAVHMRVGAKFQFDQAFGKRSAVYDHVSAVGIDHGGLYALPTASL